jgi:hypothetical protein
VKTYIRNQIQEINQSRVLGVYGIFLVFIHIGTAFFWNHSFAEFLQGDKILSCWPFFLQCNEFRNLVMPILGGTLGFLYLAIAVAAVILFFHHQILWAYWFLVALNIIKFVFQLQSFELMGNYHYMPYVISLVYLFLPNKKVMIPYFIVSFYLAAGSLKLNLEWLSGAATFASPFLQGKALEMSLAAVIYLEMVIVLLLLARQRYLTFFALLCLVVFHLASIYWVGLFYPFVMFNLLAIFILKWFSPEKEFRSHQTWLGYLALTLFWFAQISMMVFPGDPAVSGQGRTIALNMFDARTVCTDWTFAEYDQKWIELNVEDPRAALRTRCDPASYWSRLIYLCKELKSGDRSFKDIHFYLSSKRFTDSKFTTHLRIDHFCTKTPAYSSLFPNSWITHE